MNIEHDKEPLYISLWKCYKIRITISTILIIISIITLSIVLCSTDVEKQTPIISLSDTTNSKNMAKKVEKKILEWRHTLHPFLAPLFIW